MYFLEQNRSAIALRFKLETYAYFELRVRICILSPTHAAKEKDIRVFEIETLSTRLSTYFRYVPHRVSVDSKSADYMIVCTYTYDHNSDRHTQHNVC